MLLKYFYDSRLAQASYMVGCAATGEALVIDPNRDIQQYLDAAANEGLAITQVTETHIHADYVSGSRELAAATGAMIYLSDEGDADWKYSYANQPNITLVKDGDTWMLGNIKLDVLHTPGHTPEHISFMVTDTAGADAPMGIFTGDFLFVGDVGRPDLLEEAAGVAGTKEPGARQQFHSVARFKGLPDYLQIWPGHGAGSACGKALGAIPSTTLGYEKLFNPAFQVETEDAFVAWLLDGQPEAPYYFAQMKRVNKEGPALLSELAPPAAAGRATLDELTRNEAILVDLRDKEAFAAAYVPGTLNIPATSNGYINYIGWFVDYDAPFYFIAPAGGNADEIITVLRSIGVDNVPHYFPASVVTDGETASLPVMKADELANKVAQNGTIVLDVRGKSEYADGHIAGAQNIPLGYLQRQLDSIPRDKTVVTQCASGYRSQIAASVLRRYGYDNVVNLADDESAWSKALPTE